MSDRLEWHDAPDGSDWAFADVPRSDVSRGKQGRFIIKCTGVEFALHFNGKFVASNSRMLPLMERAEAML